MLNHSKLLIIFIPAIILAGLALFIQVIRYEPLVPKIDPNTQKDKKELVIPILPTDPIIGEKSAPITLIAFEDFACAGCQTQNVLFNTIQTQHPGRVKIIWKGLPVTEFPYPSKQAHAYAYCANRQNKFEQFKDLAFINGQNLSTAILDSIAEEIELDRGRFDTCLQNPDVEQYMQHVESLAQLLQIQSVPTFFIDNKQVKHPMTVEGWEALLQL